MGASLSGLGAGEGGGDRRGLEGRGMVGERESRISLFFSKEKCNKRHEEIIKRQNTKEFNHEVCNYS